MRPLPHLRESGFTLVELVVTIAVLLVLLVAASPSFADFFERYRLRSAIDDSLTLFAQARQAAVEADRNVTVKFLEDAGAWCGGAIQATEPAPGELVSSAFAACDCTTPDACMVGGEELVVDGSGRPGVTLSAGANTEFTYDSKGGTLSDLDMAPALSFLSSSGRYGLQIQVSALGQARACVIAGKRPIPGYQSC